MYMSSVAEPATVNQDCILMDCSSSAAITAAAAAAGGCKPRAASSPNGHRRRYRPATPPRPTNDAVVCNGRPSSSSHRSEPTPRLSEAAAAAAAAASGHRGRTQSARQPAVRQNAVDQQSVFDESEYCIVHSNAVETTVMTPFYPTPRPGTAGGRCCHRQDSVECDRCSLINGVVGNGNSTVGSARSSSSRKSRKSSGGSSAASRLRRELRKSALEAAAVAAVAAPSSTSSSTSSTSVNIFTNLRGLFAKWLHESKAAVAAADAAKGADAESGDADDGGGGTGSVSYLNIACPQHPPECSTSDLQAARNVMSMNSSIDSDYLLHYYTSVSPSSACSTSTASTNGDFFVSGSSCCAGRAGDDFMSACDGAGGSCGGVGLRSDEVPDDALLGGGACGGVDGGGYGGGGGRHGQQMVQWDLQVDYDLLQKHNPRQVASRMRSALENQSTLTQPTKSKSLQSQTARQQKDLLCSTWPPSGRRLFALEEDDFLMGGVNCFHVMDSVMRNSRGSFEVKEFEFNIPHDDIEFRECLLRGKRRKVYRGHWHGEVTIHAYENLDSHERSKFWEEIAKLSLVRHENIFLFMGASMDPPTSQFAVVTCQRKGASLYETVHVHREKLSSNYQLSIIRDLAQAAGYLHAKCIVVRRFNSSNIFLEPRAKLSLMDYSVITEEDEDRPGHLIVPESLIWYAPPEILTLLTAKTSYVPDSAFTVASDIFAFSIIMFEVSSGRYPFGKCDRLQYMEHVCRGERDQTQEIKASDAIKSLISDCWNHDPLYRPEFSHINMALNNRDASHLRHSSSEPENLHRLNMSKIGYL